MILVTGGTGLLGSHVIHLLLQKEIPVRVLTRGATDWQDRNIFDLRNKGVEVIIGDIRDRRKVSIAVESCDCIINLAGIMRQTKDENFEEVHIAALENLLAEAAGEGVQRFIQVSCIGAGAHDGGALFHSKKEAEKIVKKSDFYWTIFRPAFFWSEEAFLVKALLSLSKSAGPMVPVPGSGENRLQLVDVEDTAKAIIDSIYRKETVGNMYELVGPEKRTLQDLLSIVNKSTGKNKPLVNVSLDKVLGVAAMLEKVLPHGPINAEVIKLLISDYHAKGGQLESVFGIEPSQMHELYIPS
jgi:NADH dehydrogenase